ncbi:hypothetical protein ACMD2_23114 [Ananas comosus]|uniref:J domain-containing protein n=1 Tax=Ananas comosus TaxID=4615 RepID=A0A199VWK2_ANACO|nr:hypothetical protein ACMD2_23114 [Ananas comosus]
MENFTLQYGQGERSSQKPSKNYIRYAVRRKRAESKKALKDSLLYGKSSHLNFQLPASAYKQASDQRASALGWQSNQSFYDFHDEDDFIHPGSVFETVFGRHRGFAWSYILWENFRLNDTKFTFKWSDESRRQKARKRIWSESDDDGDDESTNVGSQAHRVTLGLPLTGPLKLDEVKSAFRVSALKWHPDKHQGPSQAVAEEKFKLCVNAYNSLASSGLLTCWSSRIFSCSEVITKNFSLTIRLSHAQSGETFYVANVYGPPSWEGTDDFCMELLLFRDICKGGWVVCDDFNCTISLAERRGGMWSNRVRLMFNDLIRNLALSELPMYIDGVEEYQVLAKALIDKRENLEGRHNSSSVEEVKGV